MPDTPALFALHRDVDVTQVSGRGTVAYGIEFPNGQVMVTWLGDKPSTVAWSSIHHAVAIHGHGGLTRFVPLEPGSAEAQAALVALAAGLPQMTRVAIQAAAFFEDH